MVGESRGSRVDEPSESLAGPGSSAIGSPDSFVGMSTARRSVAIAEGAAGVARVHAPDHREVRGPGVEVQGQQRQVRVCVPRPRCRWPRAPRPASCRRRPSPAARSSPARSEGRPPAGAGGRCRPGRGRRPAPGRSGPRARPGASVRRGRTAPPPQPRRRPGVAAVAGRRPSRSSGTAPRSWGAHGRPGVLTQAARPASFTAGAAARGRASREPREGWSEARCRFHVTFFVVSSTCPPHASLTPQPRVAVSPSSNATSRLSGDHRKFQLSLPSWVVTPRSSGPDG